MITVKYPEHIEAQLKILDERIAEIYQAFMSVEVPPADAMRIKRNLHEATKPLVYEKVRLIQNSCPTYYVNGDIVIKGDME